MNKKMIAGLMACAVLAGAAVGGTIAWLTDKTEKVENTFTVGDINISLSETGTDSDGKQNYDFVPGDILSKNPKVTVEAGSEACYLFLKVKEVNNIFNKDSETLPIINWNIRGLDSGNTASPENKWVTYTPKSNTETGITYYYRIVNEATAKVGAYFWILTGDEENQEGSVTVSPYVTKEMVSSIKTNKPTLTFWAAAVQYENITGDTENTKSSVDVAFEQITWPTFTN